MVPEILCYICYLISWYAIVPAIVRIFKRKSSSDYSKQAVIMEIAYNIIWLTYTLFKPTFEMVFCAIIDVILIIIYGAVVFKYHSNTGNNA